MIPAPLFRLLAIVALGAVASCAAPAGTPVTTTGFTLTQKSPKPSPVRVLPSPRLSSSPAPTPTPSPSPSASESESEATPTPTPTPTPVTTLESGLATSLGELAVASDGLVYFTEPAQHLIRSWDAESGEVATVAGTAGEAGEADGDAATARFDTPYGLALSGDGATLYVADSGNHVIRAVTLATGAVATIAGTADAAGSADADGAAARFDTPRGLCRIGSTLYVADAGNQAVRRVALAAPHAVDTLTASGLTEPYALAEITDALLVADRGARQLLKVLLADGTTTVLAGTGASGDADGDGAAAAFEQPGGLAVSGATAYLADTTNHRVRAVSLTAPYAVSTFAGSSTSGLANGSRTEARFDAPGGLGLLDGQLLVLDGGNGALRQIRQP